MAPEKSKQALDAARELSIQLQAAEARIRDLEADVQHHEARADRAENWLYQISVEIEEKFFGAATNQRAAATPRQISAEDYAPRRRSTR
jgi:Tfp pilus assembly protein PilX